MRYRIFFLFLFSSFPVLAQLGFCEGSKGDPIFHQDFGYGSLPVAPFPSSITSYDFVHGDPEDGQYTISNQIGLRISTWHNYLPPTTESNGRALIVNASYTADLFFRTEISGLCSNTTYEFSAYLMNIYNLMSGACDNGGIPVNVKFQIWDKTDSILLEEGSTGAIPSTSTAQWKQYGLIFKSVAGQDAIILKMFNNGDGGCGNDLAIDDIIFRSCGDYTEISQEGTENTGITICAEEAPVQVNLKAASDSSVYTTQFYQWQESPDNNTWQDIPGENQKTFKSPQLSSSTYYRVKVAEDPVNLLDNLCSSASEAFSIEVLQTPLPPESLGDVEVCSNQTYPQLGVTPVVNQDVNWYDAPIGGNLLKEKSSTFLATETGIYYAEARNSGTACIPGPRTSINFTVLQAPKTQDELLYLCKGNSLTLSAGLENLTYNWSTGETTSTISINSEGIYEVLVTAHNSCTTTKTIEVIGLDLPVIRETLSEEGSIYVTLEKEGSFEFSLNGVNFQDSNFFPSISGGIYTMYTRNKHGCDTVTKEFVHLVYPSFFTPNNDGHNDVFELKGISFFSSYSIKIFDRYGKLIRFQDGGDFKWDGTLNGTPLPSEDYWFEVQIEDFEPVQGHVSLLR